MPIYLTREALHKRDLTNSRGVVMCIGGPALVYYVTPTEEELFKVKRGP